jgi:hypothetical protein
MTSTQEAEYREDVRPALPSIVSSVKGTTWRDHLSVLEGLSRLPGMLSAAVSTSLRSSRSKAEWYEDLRPAIVEGIAEMDAPVPELDPSAGKDVLQTLSNVVEIGVSSVFLSNDAQPDLKLNGAKRFDQPSPP